jgi:hypothetical protein
MLPSPCPPWPVGAAEEAPAAPPRAANPSRRPSTPTGPSSANDPPLVPAAGCAPRPDVLAPYIRATRRTTGAARAPRSGSRGPTGVKGAFTKALDGFHRLGFKSRGCDRTTLSGRAVDPRNDVQRKISSTFHKTSAGPRHRVDCLVRRLTRRTHVSTFGPDRAMPAKTLSATVALAALAAVQACEICHLHYYHKVRETRMSASVASAELFIRFFPSNARRSADLAFPSAFR